MPTFELTCSELARSPWASAIDHGDYHTANILVKNGQYCVIDWGDANITHPFCSFRVTMDFARKLIPSGAQDHWCEYLRSAYLSPWDGIYSDEQVASDFDKAQWVAHICRVLDFTHMFTGANKEMLDQWRPLILEHLRVWTAEGADMLKSGASSG